MSEKEQLTQAKQQLSSSIRATWSDLKNYGKAVVNNTGAIITEARENHRIRQAERAREAEIRKRTREHKAGMKAALREQDREARRQRMISFKEGIKQKTSTAFGRLGQIKNNLVERIRPTNLDVKFRNMVDQAQIAGLTAVSKGRDFVVGTKDKVVDFASTQMANHYLRQEERQEEKAFRQAAKLAERAELEQQKARIRERRSAMITALNAQEREQYEQRHLENVARKEELMTSLFGEKQEVEIGHHARAM